MNVRRHLMRSIDTSTHDHAEVDDELGRGLVGGRRCGSSTDGMEGLAIMGGRPYPEHRWQWVPVCVADDAPHVRMSLLLLSYIRVRRWIVNVMRKMRKVYDEQRSWHL